MLREDEIQAAMVAGWNACRASIYAVCEDVQEKAVPDPDGIQPRDEAEAMHRKGYHAGQNNAAKSIARGFSSMDAMDDDNLTGALKAFRTQDAAFGHLKPMGKA